MSLFIELKREKLMQDHFKLYLRAKNIPWLYDVVLDPPDPQDAMAIFRGQKRVAFPIPKKYTDVVDKVSGAANPKLFPKLLGKMLNDYQILFDKHLDAFGKSKFFGAYMDAMVAGVMAKVNWTKVYTCLNATPNEIKILKKAGKKILEDICTWLCISNLPKARSEAEKLVKLCTKKKHAAITDAKVAVNRIDDELKKQGAFVGLF